MTVKDPAAKYLPSSVTIPSYGGKQITLLNLAAQDSGLPFNADNFSSKELQQAFNAYTAENMYAFLSAHKLAQPPGAKFQYSNLAFHDMNPLQGYRRLTFMMLDDDVVAVSPSTTYRVLKAAGRLDRGGRAPSKKGTGFVQPDGPHRHWQTDISYLNLGGKRCLIVSKALQQTMT